MGVVDVVSPEFEDFGEACSMVHKFETIDHRLFHIRDTNDTLEIHFSSINYNSRLA